MNGLEKVKKILDANQISYEIIWHDNIISDMKMASQQFDVEKCAATYILESNFTLSAVIAKFYDKRINWKKFGRDNGLPKAKLADKEKISKETGYKVGAIPPIGLDMLIYFDENLLELEEIFTGSGDFNATMKLNSQDLVDYYQDVKMVDMRNWSNNAE